MSLAEALPEQINRVREIQDEYKKLRGMKNVICEPQIVMMEAEIREGIDALGSQDVVRMLRAYDALKAWQE